MKYLILFLRVALGLLFIYSGLVKANDPMGLVYKMNEIFEAWGMNSLVHYSFALSVGMIAFEIFGGVAMIVGNAFPTWITFMVLINVFYFFLTWYILVKGTVKECGCFGACIKISNQATFNKDVALTAISIFLWIFRFRVFPLFQKSSVNIGIVGAATVFSFGFQYYTLHHLPYHDCLAYKVGNNLWEKMHAAPGAIDDSFKTTLIYEMNGNKKEFTLQEFMDQNISENPKWKFVEQKSELVREGSGQAEIPHDFQINTLNGDDMTEDLLTKKGNMFFLFMRDGKNVTDKNREEIKALAAKAKELKVDFYILSSMGADDVKAYQEAYAMKDVKFMLLDQVVSKTAMRTDPGLMLLHDGTVVKKWSYLDYPKEIALDGSGAVTFK